MKQAEKELETFVRDFMGKNGMMKNHEDVLEVIGHLPKGYLQFKMYEIYFDLMDAQQEQKQSDTPKMQMELTM